MGDRLLPGFETPPIVEVALSVQFSSPILDGPLLMLRWSEIRDRFPQYEQVAPLSLTTEEFDVPKGLRIDFRFSNTLPTPRVLMINDTSEKVLQIQDNMFGFNWRKLRPEHEYPRYNGIIRDFEHELVDFQKFIQKENLSAFTPVQCEVTYVNHIFPEGVWENHSDVGNVIPSMDSRLTEGFLPLPEEVRYASQYVIHDQYNTPKGRLHINVEPGFSDRNPIYLMKLTARGEPQGVDATEIIKTMDVWHEWVVRGFATMTSPEMHDAWRRVS